MAAVLALMLAACGGGNGEAPPLRPGDVVVPAAPVVTITNNVSGDTATGAITFTFSFNRDVGTSFTVDDVNVTGGTKGAFTRLSGTGATLVVNPDPNTTGTVQVSVAANAVVDATGTGNGAVSAAKAFNTVAPPPATGPVLLADFDTVTPTVAGFEGADGSAIENGPAGGGSGRSFKVLRSGGQPFALGIVETTVPVTATRRTISAQVFSPLAGIPMVMKIEGPNGANSGDVAANEPVVVGWQTLTWTFSGVNPALVFNKIVLLPRLGTVDAPPGQAYYFDTLRLVEATTPPPAGGTVLANFDSVNPPVDGFEGATSTVKAGPAGGSGNSLEVLRSGGQTFALGIVRLPSTIPLEASRRTISARVFSPTAGIPMVLKLEGPNGNPSSGDLSANEQVVVGWQTLTWTVPTANTSYNAIVLLPNLGTVDAPPGKAYFFDDIQLLPAAAPSATVLANFDSLNPPVDGFEGATSTVKAGPAGGSGNSLEVLRSGGQTFALGIVRLPSTIPLEASRRTISARVFSPTAGIPMVLKLEGPNGNPSSGDLSANEQVVVGWQTLTWTVPTANTSYNAIVLLPNLGTVDAPPGKAYFFDDIQLLGASSGGGGGGGGGSGPLTFSSGFAAGNRTVQGGEFGGFSGSNQDNFGCNGTPAFCGGGGDITPAIAAADSFFFYYYQTPTPATALYMGIYVLGPGITGGLSPSADNTGIQINGQTSIKFKVGQNAEWFNAGTNKFAVDLTLGKRYVVGGNTCRVQLRTIVTPTAAAATAYTVPLSAFSVVQDCAQGGLTVASALAASPISQVSFQGAAGGAALSAGGQTTGANLTVANNGVYPTTLVLVGGITFE
jgi:hypothetical protein